MSQTAPGQDAPLPVVVCVVGDQRYAIPVRSIIEVAALVQLTPVPDAPAGMLGVVNRHGAVLPVLDLRQRLGGAAGRLDLSTMFIVVEEGPAYRAGLVVDDILDVTTLPAGAITRPAERSAYLDGMTTFAEAPLLILDVAALLGAVPAPELPPERGG